MKPMKSPNEGKTHAPMGKMSPKGGRDSAVATGTSSGGKTKMIDKTKGQHIKRSSGSFAAYKK